MAVTLGPEDIHRYTWDPEVLEPVLAAEFQNYLRQIPKPAPREPFKVGGDLASRFGRPPRMPSSALDATMTRFETRHDENRTKAEFRKELEEWMDGVRNAFPDVVRDVIAITQPPARFTVHNLRGRFLEDVEVEVHLEGPVIQHPKPLNEHSFILDRLPRRPRNYGPWIEKHPDYRLVPAGPAAYTRPARPNATTFRNSGSVTAVLRCKELRPEKRHTFTEADDHRDLVLLTSDLDLDAVHITATPTARGINRTCKIEFSHPVAAPMDATELVRGFLKRTRGYYFEANV